MLVLNAGGYYLVYFQLLNRFQISARGKLSEQIPPDKLEIIAVSNSADKGTVDFERTGSDEIKYNGRMYDIFHEENSNGTTYFYCVNDVYEDLLMNAFSEYLNDDTDDDTNASVMSILKTLITHAIVPPGLHYKQSVSSTGTFRAFSSGISAPSREIPTPPPKVFS